VEMETAAARQPFGKAEDHWRPALGGEAGQQGHGLCRHTEEGGEEAGPLPRVLIGENADHPAASEPLVEGAHAAGVGGNQRRPHPLPGGADGLSHLHGARGGGRGW